MTTNCFIRFLFIFFGLHLALAGDIIHASGFNEDDLNKFTSDFTFEFIDDEDTVSGDGLSPRAVVADDEWQRLCNHTGICFDSQICVPYLGFPLCYNPTLYHTNLPDPRKGCDSPTPVCQNGGTCFNNTCNCPEGVHGVQCETAFSSCSTANECHEGSLCVTVSGGGYRCFSLACTSQPCLNGGTCTNVQCHDRSCLPFRCTCPSFHDAPFCTKRNPCDSFPCRHGGTCTPQGVVDYRCTCPQFHSGPTCEQISPCLANPCANGGSCLPEVFPNFQCVCPLPYFGVTCSNVDHCASTPCLNKGSCFSTSFSYRCECPTGYTGPRCGISTAPATPCSSSPCIGDGCSCVVSCMHEFGYYCVNTAGYVGKQCDVAVPRVICQPSYIDIEVSDDFVRQQNSRSISKPYLYVGAAVDDKTSRDASCIPVYDSASQSYRLSLVIKNGQSPCGNAVDSARSTEVVFKNTLWLNYDTDSKFDFPRPLLDFNCSYIKEYTLTASLIPVVHTPMPAITGSTKGRMSVGLCKVSTCATTCPRNLVVSDNAIYTVAQRIHLSVSVDLPSTYNNPSIWTNIVEGFMSCSRDGFSSKISLIDGCSKNIALKVTLGQSEDSTNSVCFSFLVPRLSNCLEFYVHIRARVCSRDNLVSETCPDGTVQPACTDISKRSVTNNTSGTYGQVLGPIFIDEEGYGVSTLGLRSDRGLVVVQVPDDVSSEPVPQSSGLGFPLWYLLFALVLFFICMFLFISLVLYRRRHHQLTHPAKA